MPLATRQVAIQQQGEGRSERPAEDEQQVAQPCGACSYLEGVVGADGRREELHAEEDEGNGDEEAEPGTKEV